MCNEFYSGELEELRLSKALVDPTYQIPESLIPMWYAVITCGYVSPHLHKTVDISKLLPAVELTAAIHSLTDMNLISICTQCNGNYVCMIRIDQHGCEREDLEAELKTICVAIGQQITFSDGNPMAAAPSLVSDKARELNVRYLESILAYRATVFTGKQHYPFLHKPANRKKPRDFNSGDANYERSCFLRLINHDFDGAVADVEKMTLRIGVGNYKDIDAFKDNVFYSFQIAAYILAFKTSKESILPSFIPMYKWWIMDAAVAEEFTRAVISLVELFKMEFSLKNEEGKSPIVKAIELYVNSHYTDSELSVFGIAKRFGINASYLSRIFKDEHNFTLSSHIQRLRVEYAKRLLLESNITIDHIAERSGFRSVKTFYRLFSNQECVTPTQYRMAGGTSNNTF